MRASSFSRRRTGPATATVVALVAVTLTTSAATLPGRAVAETTDDTSAGAPGFYPATVDELGGQPNAESLESATRTYTTDNARSFELEGSIETVQTVEEEGEEVVVTLASDVVFDVDSADLSDAAARRIGELVQQVPEDAPLAVDGHTDSVGTDEDNEDLSQRRAQSVADAVAAARPDLDLTVTGHGESDLKVTESGDDVAEDRAQNRRVELRYTGPVPGATQERVTTQDVTPVHGEYVPADAPSIHAVEDVEAVADQVMAVPEGGGARVQVGVEALVVRGSTTRLRVSFTPLDAIEDEVDDVSVWNMTGDGELHPVLVDTRTLAQYKPLATSGQELETDPIRASTSVGGTVLYEVAFARPVDDLSELDVSLVPTWPTFEDVPVEWD
ncbi:OmpA family protein [Cellulosimicrobium terreum]|nr:OmpA family protein [Cellulosimicrobium terreum]